MEPSFFPQKTLILPPPLPRVSSVLVEVGEFWGLRSEFSTRVSVVDSSVVGFLGLLQTFKTQRQKIMFLYKYDFHWKSNAFLWFDFQTRGFTYQRGNAT